MEQLKKLSTMNGYINVYVHKNDDTSSLEYCIGVYHGEYNCILYLVVDRKDIGKMVQYLHHQVSLKSPSERITLKKKKRLGELIDEMQDIPPKNPLCPAILDYGFNGIEVDELEVDEEKPPQISTWLGDIRFNERVYNDRIQEEYRSWATRWLRFRLNAGDMSWGYSND